MYWFIVPISDCTDVAKNEIRSQLYCFLKEFKCELSKILIEPIAPVAELSIINASFIIRLLAEDYPPPLILYAVIHPLKEQPERIVGLLKKKNIIFIGRNTGVFGWLVKDCPGCVTIALGPRYKIKLKIKKMIIKAK